MELRNSARHYGAIARALHWSIAALIFALLIVGWTMDDIGDSHTRYLAFLMHKSTGLLVLGLVLCRLVWRFADPPPPPLPGTPPLIHMAAAAAHWGLYGLMLAMPLSGWLLHSAAGRPLPWFGIEGLNVPALIPPDRALREELGEVHETIAWILVALVVLHVAGAFYHHLVLKDSTMHRMSPHAKPPADQ